MHTIGKKQGFVILIALAIILGAAFIREKPAVTAASMDSKSLDEKLLIDLRTQLIAVDPKTACIMECSGIKQADLINLLAIENVNYGKCETGNCHVTYYTIEGKLNSGQEIQFKLDCGEDGNLIRDLKLEERNCACI